MRYAADYRRNHYVDSGEDWGVCVETVANEPPVGLCWAGNGDDGMAEMDADELTAFARSLLRAAAALREAKANWKAPS
jgi:hypothetical protein